MPRTLPLWLTWTILALGASAPAQPAPAQPSPSQPSPSQPSPSQPASEPAASRVLTLETVAIDGATRTSRETVLHRLPLREGEPVTPERILDAIDALRAADLFASVDFRTEPGSARGLVTLRLLVKEKGAEFRFGTGYRDLDGWYLVPAELRFDNRFGHGEHLRVTSKIGYRLGGVGFAIEQPHSGASGRTSWGVDGGGYGVSRVYFVDGVEYAHGLGVGHVGAYAGRRLGAAWRAELGVRAETVDADSSAEAYERDDLRGVARGDALPFEDLPVGVASGVGERTGAVLHAEIARDTRAGGRRCDTPVSGFWGRVRAEAIRRGDARTAAITTDLRAYRAVGDLAFAVRLRGGVIGAESLFYDRFRIGGLYTVRGFPSQSLGPPDGDTRFWTGTIEMRGPLVGRPDRPTLAGAVFLDAGDGWSSGTPALGDAASAIGFGLRLRVPWFESVGVDFGIPFSESPVGESFHANGALGWNF